MMPMPSRVETPVERFNPKHTFADLFFSDEIMANVHAILEDQQFQSELSEHGLAPRKKILLYGPPGCGKTSIAHALAAELKFPLYALSAAQMDSEYKGVSEKNAEATFMFAETNKVVLLIDECDALFANRLTDGNSSAQHHNKTVNTLLTSLENRLPLGLTIACTNLVQIIDPAILRRFDMVFEITAPSTEGLRKIAESIIKDRFDISIDDIIAQSPTPALVARTATAVLRRKIIEHAKATKKSGPDLAREFMVSLETKIESQKRGPGRLRKPRPSPAQAAFGDF